MLIDQDPAYLPIRGGVVASTREFAGGNAVASYNADGRLLGVELLAPISPTAWEEIMENQHESDDSGSDPDILGSIPR